MSWTGYNPPSEGIVVRIEELTQRYSPPYTIAYSKAECIHIGAIRLQCKCRRIKTDELKLMVRQIGWRRKTAIHLSFQLRPNSFAANAEAKFHLPESIINKRMHSRRKFLLCNIICGFGFVRVRSSTNQVLLRITFFNRFFCNLILPYHTSYIVHTLDSTQHTHTHIIRTQRFMYEHIHNDVRWGCRCHCQPKREYKKKWFGKRCSRCQHHCSTWQLKIKCIHNSASPRSLCVYVGRVVYFCARTQSHAVDYDECILYAYSAYSPVTLISGGTFDVYYVYYFLEKCRKNVKCALALGHSTTQSLHN